MTFRFPLPAGTACLALLLAAAPAVATPADPAAANAELAKMYADDQADRAVAPGEPIDWEVVSERDERRQARVRQLLAANALATGADYYHAAMVLQHASEPDDFLLAHDLCVIAIGKGEERAKWLAAASLDRFLINVGRPQRFGTQYQSPHAFRPPRLVPVDPTVPDSLRRAMAVPTLAEAKVKEQAYAEAFLKRRAQQRK